MASTLNKLIFIICFSVIAFVGIGFINCNFITPSSPTCKESERRGYETLLTVLTTIIALRTKIDD